MPDRSRVVLIFVKFPEPGRVKSRLAQSIGSTAALAVYERLVCRTLAALSGTDTAIWFCGEPPHRLPDIEAWLRRLDGGERLPRAVDFFPQAPGDLGEKLEAAFCRAVRAGFNEVVAIGTDCPGLSARHLQAAWQSLEQVDVVFGPALDGGYYLIGLRRLAPELFRDIPWSSPRTLMASRAAAETAGFSVALLETLRDIDTDADLRAEAWLLNDPESRGTEPPGA